MLIPLYLKKSKPIKPIGIKIDFNKGGDWWKWCRAQDYRIWLEDFFIVRQKRIPTILAQSIGIATTKHGNLPTIKVGENHIIESFLTPDVKKKPRLGTSLVQLNSSQVLNNALLCPEASNWDL